MKSNDIEPAKYVYVCNMYLLSTKYVMITSFEFKIVKRQDVETY